MWEVKVKILLFSVSVIITVCLVLQLRMVRRFDHVHIDGVRAAGTQVPKPDIHPTTIHLIANGPTSETDVPKCVKQRGDKLKLTWKKKTFCHDFVVNTFHDKIPVCGGTEVSSADQVKCYGSVYTNRMAMCSYENIAILNSQQMIKVIPNDLTWRMPKDKTINLLQSTEVSCNSPSLDHLEKKTDMDDFQVKLTQHLLGSEKLSPSVCDVWINKTTFFHVSNALHIYFRFLDLYSVHKAIFDYNITEGDYQVVRIGSIDDLYRFPEFDKDLFPGELTLKDLQGRGKICFKKAILTPRSYQSLPFRCKMSSLLRKRCFECGGKGLTGSPLYSFRTRVLKACNITDQCSKNNRLVIVSRKPYERWIADDPKKFERVLRNENEMVTKIHQAFPNVSIKVIHMEDLGVCEQVRYAVEADVMIGVHGAGLVHFWWLRDNATAIELEPSHEISNPSFSMLTTLAGRNYISERIKGPRNSISVNIGHILQKLSKYFQRGTRYISTNS